MCKPHEIWPMKERYYQNSMMRSPIRPSATSSELGRPQTMVPRGSAEGAPTYGTTITPDTLRQIVETLEQLDWVVAVKSLLARQRDPRDPGGEAGLESCEVGGEYTEPMDPKIRNMAGAQNEEKPYPWPTPSQSSHYQAAAGPRPKTGPLAERYALERQVAKLENTPGPLDHGERRRILAMAGMKDAEYRDQRDYKAHRARRYCENNPGTSYEQAMYRLGIDPPADLVPTS